MDALSASCVDQRRCNLAEQGFHEAREFDPASRARLHERSLLVEQAWLARFGFACHYGLSPFLIRTGESLGRVDLGTHRAQDMEWKVRLVADLETRCCRFSHPC